MIVWIAINAAARYAYSTKGDGTGNAEAAPRHRDHRDLLSIEMAVGMLLLAVSVASLAIVGVLFVWAARKDGEADRTRQTRLGIRRRTRLGR